MPSGAPITPVSIGIGFDISKVTAGVQMTRRQMNELQRYFNRTFPEIGLDRFIGNLESLVEAGGATVEQARLMALNYANSNNVAKKYWQHLGLIVDAESEIEKLIKRNTTHRERYNAGIQKANTLYREHGLPKAYYDREMNRLRDEWRASPQNPMTRFKNAILPAGAIGGMLQFAAPGLIFAGIKKSLDLFAESERAEVAFEVMTKNVGAARDLVNQMRILDRETLVSFRGIQKAGQMMLGYGVNLRQVMPSVKALSEISMGDEDRFRGLALAFSQVAAQGRMAGQEVIQFVNAGFNPLQEISRKTGKTMSELLTMMEKRQITFDMTREAIMGVVEAGGKFYNMNERMKETLSGSWSKLVSAFTSLGIAIGESLAPAMIEIAELIERMIGSVGQLDMTNVGAQSKLNLANIKIPSFAGGGATPVGPRSGGNDGKGGFLANLHPNEIIIDLDGVERPLGASKYMMNREQTAGAWGQGWGNFGKKLIEEIVHGYGVVAAYNEGSRHGGFSGGLSAVGEYEEGVFQRWQSRRLKSQKADVFAKKSINAQSLFDAFMLDNEKAYKGKESARKKMSDAFIANAIAQNPNAIIDDETKKLFNEMLDDVAARYDTSKFDSTRSIRERTSQIKAEAKKAKGYAEGTMDQEVERQLHENRTEFMNLPEDIRKSFDGRRMFKEMNRATERLAYEQSRAESQKAIKQMAEEIRDAGDDRFQIMRNQEIERYQTTVGSLRGSLSNAQQNELAKIHADVMKAINDLQKAEEAAERKRKAETIKEGQKTIEQRLNDTIDEIVKMMDEGSLTQKEGKRAMGDAIGEAIDQSNNGISQTVAPAIRKGSKAAFDFINKDKDKQLREMQIQTKVQKKTNQILNGIKNRPVRIF